MSRVIRGANGTLAANFGDIGLVARAEKQRLMGSVAESPDVQLIRMRAADEAAATVREASEQAEAMREQAQREGYDAGYAHGHAAALEHFTDQIAQERVQVRQELAAFAEQLDSERRQLWRDTEAEIIAFVLQVAQKVVKDEAKVNREVALSVIRHALRRVVEGDQIRIRVNVDELDTIRAAREDLLAIVDGLRSVEIVDDRRVGAGGCVIETASGTIDAKIETQIDEIHAALRVQLEEAA